MNTTELLAALDGEIARLTHARELLRGLNTEDSLAEQAVRKRGRKAGSGNTASGSKTSEAGAAKRRPMSAEGKARIAAAQRARRMRENEAAKPALKRPARSSVKASPEASPAAKRGGAKRAGAKAAATKEPKAGRLAERKLPVSTKVAVKKTSSKTPAPRKAGATTTALKGTGKRAETTRTRTPTGASSSKADLKGGASAATGAEAA